MRHNGTLKIAFISEDTENEYGEIVQGKVAWSHPYDCLITTNSDNRIGRYEDGEFRMSSYTILIENSKEFYAALAAECGSLVVTEEDGEVILVKHERPIIEMVSLTRYGEHLGEFSVQSLEAFPAVGRVQIHVV